jgi:hypothetical protein
VAEFDFDVSVRGMSDEDGDAENQRSKDFEAWDDRAERPLCFNSVER